MDVSRDPTSAPPPPPPLSLIPLSDEAFWRTTNFFLYWHTTMTEAINFHNLDHFAVHFNPGIPISKLLIFINSKNLRTIRKLIAFENFQDYSIVLRVWGRLLVLSENGKQWYGPVWQKKDYSNKNHCLFGDETTKTTRKKEECSNSTQQWTRSIKIMYSYIWRARLSMLTDTQNNKYYDARNLTFQGESCKTVLRKTHWAGCSEWAPRPGSDHRIETWRKCVKTQRTRS